MRILMLIAALTASSAGANPYAAAPEPPTALEEDPFSWASAPVVVHPGGSAQLAVTLTVPTGTHVYRDQLEVEVLDDGGLKTGKADFPPGRLAPDPANPKNSREMYDVDVVVYVPISAPKKAEGPSTSVRLSLRHQGCREGLCFPPSTTEQSVLVPIRPEPGT